MRYDSTDDLLYVSVKETVASARRGLGAHPSSDSDEPSFRRKDVFESCEKIELKYNFSKEKHRFCLYTSVKKRDDGTLIISYSCESARGKLTAEEKKQSRGEGYLTALLYMKNFSDTTNEVTIEYHFFDRRGSSFSECEKVMLPDAERFFEKCIDILPSAAAAEIDRVTVRLPSMKALKFPYGNCREGQDEFIRVAYRAIAKGNRLYATAPTGTGKTVSSLFPAIRAMGNGKCSKIFYLTPKTTTAAAAKACIEKLCSVGGNIRAIILTAKEKACFRGNVCKLSRRLCKISGDNKTAAAATNLFNSGIAVVTNNDIVKWAKEFNVCPYELSLTYSELCDVVICDFNYLFDPNVYIRRYFDEGGDFSFLIDEAHNLGERAREMYSEELIISELPCAELLGPLSKLAKCANKTYEALSSVLLPLLRDETYNDKNGIPHGAYHTKEPPFELYSIFEELYAAAEEELLIARAARDEEKDERLAFIKDYLYKVKGFLDALNRFDSCYELFIFLDGGEIRLKIFCLDTGPVIRSRLELGRSAVIFSGTLSPLEYYKSTLGAEAYSDSLAVDSPFDSENVSVSIMNKITTRLSEREDSLPAVVRVIAATLSAKRGHYMIFTPSYSYAESLFNAFQKKYPKIKAILQTPNMTGAKKEEFLSELSKNDGSYLAAFCVLGGIYSEGIDLDRDKLIGAVIVGIGMPALSYEREAIAAYYEEKLEEGKPYAYLYPGMNKVLQAAGRVIRTEEDRGVIVLIDDRFDDPLYKKLIPKVWSGMQFLSDAKDLKARLEKFWSEN